MPFVPGPRRPQNLPLQFETRKPIYFFNISMRWLHCCIRGGFILASRRASPRLVVERVAPEMTVCITFGVSSFDGRARRFRYRSKYVTFSINFGALSRAAQELIWFHAHSLSHASASCRRRLPRSPPSRPLPAHPGDARAPRPAVSDAAASHAQRPRKLASAAVETRVPGGARTCRQTCSPAPCALAFGVPQRPRR